ncbi:lipase family protein [Chloroflexi bacterium TSY]|nr:lipase family protein [Chloroflexi bacterium TSY]
MMIRETMIDNLNFTEAIRMAELTERSHQIVEQARVEETQTHYNALFKSDKWRCVHAIHHAPTRTWAHILQRKDSARFAVVCGHRTAEEKPIDGESTSANNAHTAPSDTTTTIAVTNVSPPKTEFTSFLGQLGMSRLGIDKLGIDKIWDAFQQRVRDHSVAYSSFGNEGRPPPESAKVYGVWFVACQSVQDEIDLFFRALSGLKFVQPCFERLAQRSPHQQAAYRAAIGAALQLRFGPEVGQKMLQRIRPSAAEEGVGQDASSFAIPTELFDTEQNSLPLWQISEDGFELRFTGHGTGGAVTVLCALYMKRAWEAYLDFPLFRLHSYTFGSPKLGNRAFVEYYNQQLPDGTHRIQNLMDSFTYGPFNEVPFSAPNPLTWRLPTLDSLRSQWRTAEDVRTKLSQVRDQWVVYEHVGEPFRHPGMGNAPTKFNFSMGIKPLILPFEHDPAGYKALLVDAQAQYEAFSKPIRKMTEQFEKGKKQLSVLARSGASQAQELFNQLQNRMMDS